MRRTGPGRTSGSVERWSVKLPLLLLESSDARFECGDALLERRSVGLKVSQRRLHHVVDAINELLLIAINLFPQFGEGLRCVIDALVDGCQIVFGYFGAHCVRTLE